MRNVRAASASIALIAGLAMSGLGHPAHAASAPPTPAPAEPTFVPWPLPASGQAYAAIDTWLGAWVATRAAEMGEGR